MANDQNWSMFVGIPWRSQRSRKDAFEHTVGVYRYMGAATIIQHDSLADPFSLAETRNQIVERARANGYRTVVISDADTFPDMVPLTAAMVDAEMDCAVHLPYTEYRSLMLQGTAQLYRGEAPALCSHLVVPTATSGIFVCRPEAWDLTAGQDPRFKGWGFEDVAWLVAYRTMTGTEPVRHQGNVYALHHSSAPKSGDQYEANLTLYHRYLAASGSQSAMIDLIREYAPDFRR